MSRLPALLAEVRDLLVEDWPDYADFLDSDAGGVRDGAALFVQRLLDMVDAEDADGGDARDGEGPVGPDQTVRLVFEQIGRRQWHLGSDLTRLLTAYQIGARAAWRHVSTVALELDLDPRTLADLAQAVFVFVNQLSSASARGYVLEQIEDSRERERRRDELAELLLSDRAGLQAVRTAATRARWELPSSGAVVLTAPGDQAAGEVISQLDARCLPVRREGLLGAIVPGSQAADRERMRRRLRGANAVVGYTVPLDRLPSSLGVAQIAARLRAEGVLVGDPVFAEEHLDTIIVHREERMLDRLRQEALRPLDGLPEGPRRRLVETLTSWLVHQGNRQAVAADLNIHPQTVRYRLAQLRELFGEELDSPRSRARLFLSLVWPVR
jgi:hypothetical protein